MDAGSITELFNRHGAAVYRRCRQLLRDEQLARDAVQDVFLKAFAERKSFRGDSSRLTWLFGIATMHCLQQLRNTARRERKLSTLAMSEAAPEQPDDHLRLLALLEEFPLDVQRVVFMRHVDELSIEEIAAATGVSTKTVSRKLADYMERSRASLEVRP